MAEEPTVRFQHFLLQYCSENRYNICAVQPLDAYNNARSSTSVNWSAVPRPFADLDAGDYVGETASPNLVRFNPIILGNRRKGVVRWR